MSRIGTKPIDLPSGVGVKIEGSKVTVKGPNGTLEHTLPVGITIKQEESRLLVARASDDKQGRVLHGLTRSLVYNMVVGVTDGYRINLEIVGVSYQAILNGNKLTLKLGYANDIVLTVPAGVTVEVPNPTAIGVTGADKQKVGQFAAEVRGARPPEPYKGKGVRYRGEKVQRKQGKSFVGSE